MTDIQALSKELFIAHVSDRWADTAPQIGVMCDEVARVVMSSRWLAEHDQGQQVKGIRRLLDYRPLPRDVRLYIEGYLEAWADESVSNVVRPLDPEPWVWVDSVYGQTHRTADPPTMPTEHPEFDPRPQYEQDRAKYGPASSHSSTGDKP